MTSAVVREGPQLVLTLREGWIPVRYQLQLLNRGRPPGLLPCTLRQKQAHQQLCIDTTGCLPLPAWQIENQPDRPMADGLIHQLQAILSMAESHLLPAGQFDFEPRNMYIQCRQNSTVQLALVFWPCTVQGSTDDEPDDWSAIRQSAGLALMNALAPSDNAQADRSAGPDCPAAGARANSPMKHKLLPFPYLNTVLSCWRCLIMILAHLGLGGAGLWLVIRPATTLTRGSVLLMTTLLLLTDVCRLLPQSTKDQIRQRKTQLLAMVRRQLSILLQPRPEVALTAEQNRLRETGLYPDDPALFRIAVLVPESDETNQKKAARATIHILVEQFVIGRDQQRSDLCLTDPSIGRQHARISRSGGSFFITDLGSRNGSWLDRQRLLAYEEVPLPDQCRLKFGQCLFLFRAED